MHRRTLIRRGAAAGALVLAGCSGGTGDAEDGGGGRDAFEISDFRTKADDAGDLVVETTVSNLTDEHQTGTLYVNVEVSGTPSTRVRNLDLDAASTRTYDVGFDVQKEAFDADGDLSFDVTRES